MMFHLAACLLLQIGSQFVNGELYVDPVLPYNPGELAVSDRILSPPLSVINPPPMHTRVFYPDPENITEGTTFGVYYFISGWGGLIYPHAYKEYLSRVASHGYVVLGSWPLVDGQPGLNDTDFSAQPHIENIEYLKENLPIRIRNMADFDNLAVGCHSAGCGPTFNMVKMSPENYKATINLEPVSGAIFQGVDFDVPGLFLGAELAYMSCTIPGFGFGTFYSLWGCPRVMFEVAGVGHCGFLEQIYWTICDATQRCRTGDEANLPAYRTLVEGVTSAMLNTYIQGSHDHLRYVTDPDLYPMALVQHEADTEC